MAESPSLPELPRDVGDDTLEINRYMDRMREDVENMAVQLTWLVYDTVALRTRPELAVSMQKLEEAYRRCKAAVQGDKDEEPKTSKPPDAFAAAQADSDRK